MFRQNRVDEDQLPDMRQCDFRAEIKTNRLTDAPNGRIRSKNGLLDKNPETSLSSQSSTDIEAKDANAAAHPRVVTTDRSNFENIDPITCVI